MKWGSKHLGVQLEEAREKNDHWSFFSPRLFFFSKPWPAQPALEKKVEQAILAAGVGFFSDAYDLFIIGLAKPAIGVVYFPEHGGKLPTSLDLAITGVSLVGALTGQVVFG